MKQCSIQDCPRNSHAKGRCGYHYRLATNSGEIIPDKIVTRPAIIMDNFAKIPLGYAAKYGYALVDLEDSWLEQYKWTLHAGRYVMATIGGLTVQIHRLILKTPSKLVTDHINGDRLDNRKKNLRICSQAENSRNRTKSSKTGFKGVSKKGTKYQASIGLDYKKKYLGLFNTIEEAAQAYDVAAIRIHGQFSKINFPS